MGAGVSGNLFFRRQVVADVRRRSDVGAFRMRRFAKAVSGVGVVIPTTRFVAYVSARGTLTSFHVNRFQPAALFFLMRSKAALAGFVYESFVARKNTATRAAARRAKRKWNETEEIQ
jgi:hypothetical protein